MTLQVLSWSVVAFSLAALAGAALPAQAARRVVYGSCALLGAAGIIAALPGLVAQPATAPEVTLPLGIPWLGMHLRLDALSAFAALIVNLGALTAGLYGLGHGRHDPHARRVLPFFAAFLAGMNLVVIADDAFTFLLAWEVMSLMSWALVKAHHDEPGNEQAGQVYLVMAGFGTLALLLAFGMLAGPEGAYGFAAMRTSAHAPWAAGAVLLLALVGAGSKAGIVPLHVWLPLAHPAAPSHVSALMSGVMTKVALYGFLRLAFDLAGPPAWWWSVAVLLAGGATAVFGVLQALMQSDLKRLLAFSTVENVGMIFIGLGLSLAFKSNQMDAAAALALTAALLHMFNHSIFKSLLFLGAGAVLSATGERSLDRLGGLIHRMPRTALAFLVGAAAISALPPLNGFASEWLTFQAILISPELPQWGLRLMIPAVGGALALAAALAGACFVRAFGITFLGRPRSEAARNAAEVDAFSTGVLLGLAALCLIVGVLPGVAIDALAPVGEGLVGHSMPRQTGIAWLSIVPVAQARSSYNGLLVLVFMSLSAGLSAFVIHRVASRSARRAPAWDCGHPDNSPQLQYSASSLSQPIRRVLGTQLLAARESVEMPPPGATAPARFHLSMVDPAWRWIYTPLVRAVAAISGRLDVVQRLTIRQYLSLVFLALLTLLVVLVPWP